MNSDEIKRDKLKIVGFHIFPVLMMLFYMIIYLGVVTAQLREGAPTWETFLANMIMLGSQIGRSAIKNEKVKEHTLFTVFLILLGLLLGGLVKHDALILKICLYASAIVFFVADAWDMLQAGVRGSINELENTNIPECHCQSKCLKLGERESGSKMCSSKEHTEQHVHKNIKNTFFNIIIQRPIQITKNQEENEETLLQENELSEVENQ